MMRKFAGTICVILSILIAAGFIYHYGPIFMDYKKSSDLYDGLKDDYTNDGEDSPEIDALMLNIDHVKNEYAPIDVDSEKLQDQNPDYLGWIYVPKTDISYPVVKSADNVDYLHTDFNRSYSFPGTIFMDCRCKSGILNHHSILYGHNMNNGTMFAGLKSFSDQKYADEHPVFWFITPKYKLLYKVFAVCNSNPYDRKQYGVDGENFKNNEEFGEAVNYMLKNSVVKMDTDPIEDTDYVMSLSTCTGNSSVRCIVHGVLLGSVE